MPFRCPPGTVPYRIRSGDTYYKLAKQFNTTIAALVSANPTYDPNNLPVGQPLCIPRQPVFPPCPEQNYYTIRPGDRLYRLADFFGISLDDLLEANPAIDPQNLRPGQVICIPLATPPVVCPPGTRSYTVRPGDSFYRIARQFNTTVDAIMEANPTIDPFALLIGQKLCIP
ncbi:muramidase family protein [Heliorestis convoluta]|uniref:LysM domain protein n=1 Tax=Heliorestis convoluta TaxID=356322 RepID=A0A5Q2N4F9_9FIRM|nr:LysM peptidoglycan-binding domain-containing protein [Heliorestis convoluta]QGG47140.1 LysM domain protein [Heliorestis convoluta]